MLEGSLNFGRVDITCNEIYSQQKSYCSSFFTYHKIDIQQNGSTSQSIGDILQQWPILQQTLDVAYKEPVFISIKTFSGVPNQLQNCIEWIDASDAWYNGIAELTLV